MTHTSNLEWLEIDALVDLANPKLVTRYNESSQPVAVTQPPKPAQSHTWTAKWTNENWAARDLDFKTIRHLIDILYLHLDTVILYSLVYF